MKEIPRWLYKALFVLAIVVAAAKLTLVGKLSFLMHDSDGEALVNFCEAALLLAGFGSAMKRKPMDEPLELPPPPKAGEV